MQPNSQFIRQRPGTRARRLRAARAGREGRESASGSPRVPDRAGTRARARNCHCQQRRHWWRNFGPPAGESTASVATGCSRCRRPTRPRGSQYREESLQNARRRRRRGSSRRSSPPRTSLGGGGPGPRCQSRGSQEPTTLPHSPAEASFFLRRAATIRCFSSAE